MMFPRDLVVRQTSSAYEDDEASTSTPAPATRTRTRTRTPPTPSSNSPTPPASSASLPPTSNSDARENGNGNGSSNGDSGLPINVIVGGTLAGMALAIAIIMAWAYFSRALKRRREVESKKAYWLEATKNNTLHNIAPSNPSMTMRGTGSPHPVSVAVKPANSRVTFTGRGRKNSSDSSSNTPSSGNGKSDWKGGDLEKGLHQRPPGLAPSQPRQYQSQSIPSSSKPQPQISPSLPKALKPLRPPKRINPDACGNDSGSGSGLGSPTPSFESRDTTRSLLQRNRDRDGEVERERERNLIHMPSSVSSASWYSTESAEEHLARPPASLVRAAFTRMGVGVEAAMNRSCSYSNVGGEQRQSRGSRQVRGGEEQPSRISQATTTSAYSQTAEGVAL